MDREAREARELAKTLPFKKKMEHIWHYYHTWFYVGLVFVLMIGITIYQVATRPNYDLVISYYGENVFTEESLGKLEEYLAQFVEDMNGDGVKNVHIAGNYLSAIDSPMNNQNAAIMQKQMADVSAGTYPVFIFDKSFADSIVVGSYEGMFYPLAEMDKVPEIADILQLSEKQDIYWATRIPQERENNQKKIEMSKWALAIQKSIFGE